MKAKSVILFLSGVSYAACQNFAMRFYSSDNCTGNYGISRGGARNTCISVREFGTIYSSVTTSSFITGTTVEAYAFQGQNECGVYLQSASRCPSHHDMITAALLVDNNKYCGHPSRCKIQSNSTMDIQADPVIDIKVKKGSDALFTEEDNQTYIYVAEFAEAKRILHLPPVEARRVIKEKHQHVVPHTSDGQPGQYTLTYV